MFLSNADYNLLSISYNHIIIINKCPAEKYIYLSIYIERDMQYVIIKINKINDEKKKPKQDKNVGVAG